eukprot:gene28361-34240_t
MAEALSTVEEWVRHNRFSDEVAQILVNDIGVADLRNDLRLVNESLSQENDADDFILSLKEFLHSIGEFDRFRDALRDYVANLDVVEEADPASSFILVDNPNAPINGSFGGQGGIVSPIIDQLSSPSSSAYPPLPPGPEALDASADDDNESQYGTVVGEDIDAAFASLHLEAREESASIMSPLTEESGLFGEPPEEADDRSMSVISEMTEENSLTVERQRAIASVLATVEEKGSLDLVFLMDLTSTMGPYIDDVKDNIRELIRYIAKMQIKFRIAFVGYRDHGDKERLVTLKFTHDVEEVIEFLNKQKAEGGGDEAEDVLGGMNVVANKDWWQYDLRVVYHIGDAPCHGSSFHSRLVEDRYPNGYKGDPEPLAILQKLKADRVKYIFIRIDNSTDLMINRFNNLVAEESDASDKFIETLNVDSNNAQTVMLLISKSLSAHVSKSLSAVLSIGSGSSSVNVEEGIDELEFIFSSSGVNEEYVMQYPLLPIPDNGLEGFLLEETDQSVAAIAHPYEPIPVEIESAIFAKGSHRIARKGRRPLSHHEWESAVFKTLLSKGRRMRFTRAKCEKFLSCHRAARFCAEEFNRSRPTDCPAITYIDVWLVNFCEYKHQPYMICEQLLCDDSNQYEVYNSNGKFIAPNPTLLGTNHDAVQAFSHWTYCFTRGDLMVVDCQGIYCPEPNTFFLTDPALHSIKLNKFGATNLGVDGYKMFFRSHQCNQYCIQMNIDKDRPTDAKLAKLKKKEKMKKSVPSSAWI